MQTTSGNQFRRRIEPLLPELPNSQVINYHYAERQFIQLLKIEDLDVQIKLQPKLIKDFEVAIASAAKVIYGDNSETRVKDIETEYRFIQRILYRINRLKFFWYDDLQNYENERSIYLHSVRDRLESTWQAWEMAQLAAHLDTEALSQLDSESVKQALQELADQDLNPPPSASKDFVQNHMTLGGYRLLLAIASLDGLVEASRLSRILGGASNEIQATLFRVLLEEYGNGRLARKHSTFFAQMMAELGLQTSIEAYFDLVPWQVLASINHNFLLTERKRHFLRYNGGLTYFEIAGPSLYTDYMLAAERLQLSETAMGYWKLHIREDERHGQWMLTEVALPLAAKYPNQAWELLLGYEQEKFMGDRAATAVIDLIKHLDT